MSGYRSVKLASIGISSSAAKPAGAVTRNSPDGVSPWPATTRVNRATSASIRAAAAIIACPAGVGT